MRKFFFLFITIGTLLMILVMYKTGASLKTNDTPNGILDLEFASNAAKATAVVNAWQKSETVDNIQIAKLNTELDFIFLFFYSIFLNMVCRSIAALHTGMARNIGLIVATGAIIAGMLDILENIGMLLTLHGYIYNSITILTFSFSVTKWILALLAILYFLVAGCAALFKKDTGK